VEREPCCRCACSFALAQRDHAQQEAAHLEAYAGRLTTCSDNAAHRTFEEESDGFLLHKINVKTALAQSDRPRSDLLSPVLDYHGEGPVDHSVSQYVEARHNAVADRYVDEVQLNLPKINLPCRLPAEA